MLGNTHGDSPKEIGPRLGQDGLISTDVLSRDLAHHDLPKYNTCIGTSMTAECCRECGARQSRSLRNKPREMAESPMKRVSNMTLMTMPNACPLSQREWSTMIYLVFDRDTFEMVRRSSDAKRCSKLVHSARPLKIALEEN